MVVGVAVALLPPKKEMVPDLPFFSFFTIHSFFHFYHVFLLRCRVPRISKGSFSAAQVPARVLKRAPLTCPKSAEWGLVTPAKYRKIPWLDFDLRFI